ncbi:MAG TPA: hypothetical protein VN522_06060 [Solirubrobacterales bacterium]|nr:hypothetical protein [Solirubrobacterales bacterium]
MAMDAHEESPTNQSEDARVESALLQRVLDLHPTQVTAAELIRDLAGEDADFGARDAVERAIRELTGAGLLHRTEDGLLTPTRAAVHFGELLGR